ncbi:MAG: hypothetical protein AAGJ54_03785 [Planctomycetota bacterium]
MAPKTCPKCDASVQGEEEVCDFCGAPIPRARGSFRFVAAVVGVAVVLLGVVGLSGFLGSTITSSSKGVESSSTRHERLPFFEVLTVDLQPPRRAIFDVLVEQPLREHELRSISRRIQSTRAVSYDRVDLRFKVNGHGELFWATTEFDSDFKTRIFGMSRAVYDALRQAPPPEAEECPGSWIEVAGFPSRIDLCRDQDEYRLDRRTRVDGTVITKALRAVDRAPSRLFIPRGENPSGDVFEILDDGRLRVRDDRGTISVLDPTD